MSKKRSKAREFSIQAVYQWQVSGNEIQEIIDQFLQEKNLKSFEIAYFQDLLRGVITNLDELDKALAAFIDRDIEQVDLVERAILRMAAYELIHHPEVPYRVVINEAVELAKLFGADQGHKYVNGVVDKLAQQKRAVEVSARRKTS